MGNVKEPITLPGEDGEWELVGYSFQGEPNSGGTITFHDWPGNQNVRVLVRKKEPKRPEVQLYDAVFLDGADSLGGLVYGNYIVINECNQQYGWVTVVNFSNGSRRTVPIKSITTIYRNGQKIYPSTP